MNGLTKKTYTELLTHDIDKLSKLFNSFDFIDYIEERPFEVDKNITMYFDMDGVLALWQYNLESDFKLPNGDILPKGTAVTEDLWNNPNTHYYKSLPEYPLTKFLNEALVNPKFKDVQFKILSKSPSFAVKDKYEWIKEHIPNMKDEDILIIPYNYSKKCDYVPFVNGKTILFDDYSPNLKEWTTFGGISINVLNKVNNFDKMVHKNIDAFQFQKSSRTFEAIFEEIVDEYKNDTYKEIEDISLKEPDYERY